MPVPFMSIICNKVASPPTIFGTTEPLIILKLILDHKPTHGRGCTLKISNTTLCLNPTSNEQRELRQDKIIDLFF